MGGPAHVLAPAIAGVVDQNLVLGDLRHASEVMARTLAYRQRLRWMKPGESLSGGTVFPNVFRDTQGQA